MTKWLKATHDNDGCEVCDIRLSPDEKHLQWWYLNEYGNWMPMDGELDIIHKYLQAPQVTKYAVAYGHHIFETEAEAKEYSDRYLLGLKPQITPIKVEV